MLQTGRNELCQSILSEIVFMRRLTALAFAAACLWPGVHVLAGEPMFGYVYTTDLLPQGKSEIEQWSTWRHQKAHGDFDLLENRTAYEYGVTDAFQLAGYINYSYTHAYHDTVDGSTLPPEAFADYRIGPDQHFTAKRYVGVSAEAIYRLSSPYTSPLGVALYVEPTVGRNLRELESKLILQKNFLDDRLVLAANLTVAQEGRYLPADPEADAGSKDAKAHWDHETDLNIGLAGSYRFANNWSAGVEIEHEREYSSFSLRSQYRTNLANYIGPVVHYGGEHFFFTATMLTQTAGGRDYADSNVIYRGRNYADDFEHYRLRLKAGWAF
jgi:hypothetical protein